MVMDLIRSIRIYTGVLYIGVYMVVRYTSETKYNALY